MKPPFAVILLLLFMLVSCSVQKKSHDFLGHNVKDFERAFVPIPKTSIPNPTSFDSSIRLFNSFTERIIEADSFFIFQFEISNEGYLAFLKDIKARDTILYREMLPDQEVWRLKFVFNEPLVEYYLQHPSYRNYPVVGISYEQAEAYCIWLTEKYNSIKNRRYKNVEFKLPTKNQWFIAAIGADYKNKRFPWPGNSLQSPKGDWFANFQIINQVQILRDTGFVNCHNNSRFIEKCYTVVTLDGHSIWPSVTMSVDSYLPNEYNLYNMSGNVEEFVREKGITKGGSWYDTGYYLQLDIEENYDSLYSPSCERGFRIVMEITK